MFAAVQYWRQSPRRPYGPSWSPPSRGVHVIASPIDSHQGSGAAHRGVEGQGLASIRACGLASGASALLARRRRRADPEDDGGQVSSATPLAFPRSPAAPGTGVRRRSSPTKCRLGTLRGSRTTASRSGHRAAGSGSGTSMSSNLGRVTGRWCGVPAGFTFAARCLVGTSNRRASHAGLERSPSPRSARRSAHGRGARIVSKRSRGPRHCRAPCCDPALEGSLAFHRLALCKRGDHAVHAVESATNVLLRAVCIQRSWL